MSQDLLKITSGELYNKIRVHPDPIGLYKNIMESIYEFKRRKYNELGKMGDEGLAIIKDLEQKETTIMRALIEMGYNLKTLDFQVWYKQLRNRATKKTIVK